MLPAGGFFVSWLAGRALRDAHLAEVLGLRATGAAVLRVLLRWIVPGLILLFVVVGHIAA